MKKTTSSGLARFRDRPSGSDAARPPVEVAATSEPAEKTGAEKFPATVRFSEENRRRIDELIKVTPGRRRRRASLQEIVEAGINRLLEERGLDPLKDD